MVPRRRGLNARQVADVRRVERGLAERADDDDATPVPSPPRGYPGGISLYGADVLAVLNAPLPRHDDP